jgi:hypothetical protein
VLLIFRNNLCTIWDLNIYNIKTGDDQKGSEKIKQKNKQSEGIKQKPENNMLTPGQLNLMIEGIRAWEKIDTNKFNEMVSRIKSAFP